MPPEIRVEIYKLVLVSAKPIKVTRKQVKRQYRDGTLTLLYKLQYATKVPRNRRQWIWKPLIEVLNPLFLCVSKAIRHEGLTLFYRDNHFVFGSSLHLEVFWYEHSQDFASLASVTLEKIDWRGIDRLKDLKEPKSVVIPMVYGTYEQHLDTVETWNAVKYFVLHVDRSQDDSVNKSRRVTTDQREILALQRLSMINFDVRGNKNISTDSKIPPTILTIDDEKARESKVKEIMAIRIRFKMKKRRERELEKRNEKLQKKKERRSLA